MRSTESEREPAESATPPVVGWSQFAQDAAVTLWPSFLAASVATMFFFAFFDPSLFGDGAAPPDWLADHRMAGYAVGFFFFWAICTLSSALTLYLVRTARQPGGSRGPDDRTPRQP